MLHVIEKKTCAFDRENHTRKLAYRILASQARHVSHKSDTKSVKTRVLYPRIGRIVDDHKATELDSQFCVYSVDTLNLVQMPY